MSIIFPHRTTLITVTALIGVSFALHCVGPTGGGSEAGNARITGLVRNEQGAPAANVIVQILPSDFDPMKNRAIPDSCLDTTATDGVFRLGATKDGSFTIQAVQIDSRLRALIPLVQVKSTDDTVDECTLHPPGAVKVMIDSGDGYLYIPGTMFHASLHDGGGYALLDSVPAGVIPSITYSSADGDEPVVFCRNVKVQSGDTVIIAFQDWAYSRRLLLNTSVSGADVTGDVYDFPILVRFTGNNFVFSQARPDGGDLRFSGSNNTPLPHEIERWDPVAELAEVWVNVDTIRGNDSAQFISMYWGNATAEDNSNGAVVFDTAAGFQGVWHLGDAAGNLAKDATANQYHGTSPDTAHPTITEGVAGNCRAFDGAADYITIPSTANGTMNFPEDGYYSVSAWVFLDTIDNRENAIVTKGGTQYFLMVTYVPTDLPLWDFAEFGATDGWLSYTTPASSRQWTLLTAVCRGDRQLLYCNGVLVDSVPNVYAAGSLSRNTSNDLTIGRFLELVSSVTGPGTYCFFKGSIDEVRISSTAASPDWVRLCYMNQRPEDRLVVFK